MKQSVASFWFTPSGGKGISKLEFLTIKSWLDNGFKFILYTYNLNDAKLKALAENCQEFSLKDAQEVVPFQEFFSDNQGGGRFCLFRLFSL